MGKSATIYRAYFDREPTTIDGLFSLQAIQIDGQTLQVEGVRPLFQKLPARSGQRGYTHIDWAAAKSPIPYSNSWPPALDYRLWLEPRNPEMFPSKPNGIGRFWPISNTPGDMALTKNPLGAGMRRDLGLHPDNAFPGSAGCTVLRHDNGVMRANVEALFQKLWEIHQKLRAMGQEEAAIIRKFNRLTPGRFPYWDPTLKVCPYIRLTVL